ncbi:hypothetical protein KEM48_013235 [Puccinia striiformis f. sp. tritici PST-130]|nr:hypothetical protein KEM48_013235 [Puccinia striiformis f. sp. tritici PST-130]
MRACREAHQIKKLSKWLLPSNELSGKSYRALRKIVARTQEQQHGAKENAAMICHQNCETDHRSIKDIGHNSHGSPTTVAVDPRPVWRFLKLCGSKSQAELAAAHRPE